MTDATLDELYSTLHAHGPDLRNGFTSHAPMVVEALVHMNQAEAARRWVASHLHEATPRPMTRERIEPDRWEAALGLEQRFADWAVLMRAELDRLGWREALDRWAGRLAPGFAAAATHGVLRTAHAARAVAEEPSEARLGELADGFALWASSHQRLPGRRDAGTEVGELELALERVPRIPLERRRNGGAITTALGELAELPEFAEVIGWFEPGDDLGAAGRRLVRAFATLFLAQVRDRTSAIVFTHAVTSTAAVLWMAPLLRDETVRALLIHAWQTGAALLAAYGAEPIREHESRIDSDAAIIRAAVAHGDDHVIKLSGACLGLRSELGEALSSAVARRARAMIPADARGC